MVTDFFAKYQLVIVLLLVIILCAVCAHNHHKEHFSIEPTLQNIKSTTFFPYIGDFVFTNLQTSLTTFTTSQKEQMLHFLPSHADALCNLSFGTSCSNYYINNLSYSDPYEYNSPISCTNIESKVGLDKSQCQVRILNNIYSIRKKCIRLTTESSNFSAIKVKSATPVSNSYIVQIESGSNNLDMLALLRPNLISFGNFGLYKIEPLATNSMFASYSSKNTSNAFVITPSLKIASAPALKIYPNIENNFISMVGSKDLNLLANIYFLNHESRVYLGGNQYFNTFNFVVDHNYLKSQKSALTPIYEETITFNTKDSNPALCTNLKYKFNITPPTNNAFEVPFFKVSLNHSGSSSQSMDIQVHSDFTNLIYSYIKKTDNKELFSNSYISWHIVVVCSLDLVIILAMFRDFTNNTTQFFMTQQAITDGGVSAYIQYMGDVDGKILDAQTTPKPVNSPLLNNHYQYFNNVCPNTVVPNLALVAKNLGYRV